MDEEQEHIFKEVVSHFSDLDINEKDILDITSSILYARLGFKKGSESVEYLANKYQGKPYHTAVAGFLYGVMRVNGRFPL